MTNEAHLLNLLAQAKTLAKEYYALTGRPLGVTGEVAEFEAIRLLGLTSAPVRQSGYDAEGQNRDGQPERIQIKGRCVVGKLKGGAKLGSIDVAKQCEAVLLVLLNADYDATVIYRAEWKDVCLALTKPGSRARNVRGQLSIAKFRQIGRRIWPAPV
jgi:hypothetical protein